MRKSLMGAVAVAAALGLAGAAVAQTGPVTLNAKLAPAKAGTKKKPKNSRLTFAPTVNLPQATVERIRLRWPATVRVSGRGFKRCTFDELVAVGPSACPRGSRAGPRGTANALVGPPGPSQASLDLQVSPFVEDRNTLLFYLNQVPGPGVQTVIRGEIRGRTLTITIPEELRKPGGLDATLTGINQTFRARSGKNFLVSTTGCRGGRHTITGTLFFSERVDLAPVPAPINSTARVRCRK